MDASAKETTHRLFCAVELSDEARAAAAAHLARLRAALEPPARVSWERAEKLHLTLKFFGGVEPARVGALGEALTRAADAVAGPLSLRLGGAGVFPAPGRPNVLWLGVADDAGGLARLHARVEDECAAAGFERDARPFQPHVTLARVRQANRETRRLAHLHLETSFEPIAFALPELVLMRSDFAPGGTAYTPVSRHALQNAERGTRNDEVKA